MAKVYSLKCPECDAPISFNDDNPIKYCPYCGNQIFFDDGTTRININSKHEQVVIDEARILHAKNESVWIKHQARQSRREARWRVIRFVIISFIIFLAMGLLFILSLIILPFL